MTYLDEVVAGYIEAALWTSTDESRPDGGDPMDDNYSPEDLAQEALEAIKRECGAFTEDNHVDLLNMEPGQVGHDFWLTRNGHGAGFWDRGLGIVGERLTEQAHAWGEAYLYVGDDGRVHYQ